MCYTPVNIARELAAVGSNPLRDLFADAIFKLAHYRGMDFGEGLRHYESTQKARELQMGVVYCSVPVQDKIIIPIRLNPDLQ